MSLQQHDKLQNLLSTLAPLEPRAELKQEILQRIQQEPQPHQPRGSRIPKWLIPTASVASFAGCLVLVVGFMFHVKPTAPNSTASSASMPAAENSAQTRSLDRTSQQAADSRQELKRGLIVTLSAPDLRKEQQTANQPQALLSTDDFKRILTELNDAGAQWVTVNGVQVAAADFVEWKANALYVHGTLLQPPYQVAVSGDPYALRASIEQKGSFINSLQTASRVNLSMETVGSMKQ